MLKRFFRDERGATAVEYGLIVVGLSLVIVGGINMLGNAVEDMMVNPARALQGTLGN